jgi:hypothetical protein
MDRKTELEQKKAKLDQLRQQKLQRSAQLSKTPSGTQLSNGASSTGDLSLTPTTTYNDVDPDKILIECGITAPILTSTSATPTISKSDLNQNLHSSRISFTKKYV